jgi:CheY-like chemotaxis protein
VLLVEDDDELAEVLLLTLEEAGFDAVLARNGLEALASIAGRMPALVLLDMLMPVMDGWEFAREFRARYGRDAAPIVVITAAEQARERAATIEADDVLAKPFGSEALVRTVARYARQKSR